MPRLNDQIQDLRQTLESWESSLGIRDCRLDADNLDAILNMDRDRLRALGAREAAEAAVVLAQFAFAVQHRENQCRAFLRWAEANRQALTPEEKATLHRLAQQAILKQDRIAYLGRRIEFLAQCLGGLNRTRSREEASS